MSFMDIIFIALMAYVIAFWQLTWLKETVAGEWKNTGFVITTPKRMIVVSYTRPYIIMIKTFP